MRWGKSVLSRNIWDLKHFKFCCDSKKSEVSLAQNRTQQHTVFPSYFTGRKIVTNLYSTALYITRMKRINKYFFLILNKNVVPVKMAEWNACQHPLNENRKVYDQV